MEAYSREEDVRRALKLLQSRTLIVPFLLSYYPWTAERKRSFVQPELDRMLAHAASQGLGPESVDSIYLRGDEALEEHLKRNGYDKLTRSGDKPAEVLQRRLS